MKHVLRRSVCASLSLLVSMSVLAQGGLTTPEQKAGYAIGVNIGSNLVSQGLAADLDVASIVAGLQESVAGAELKMTQADMEAAIQAFTALQQEKMNAELAAQAQAGRDFLTQNGSQPGVMTTDSGLQYQVIESGPADGASPGLNDSVLAHYHGTFIDGSVFDSSVDRGEPVEFGVSQVIAGWTEALQMMKPGDKWRLFIPYNLAYGETGSGPIGPFEALIFDVELIQVNAQ